MPSFWSDTRRTPKKVGNDEHRSPFQIDYDRLLFSTPVRRLADKTQVFPLDRNDGVRTRLTHSHEVSNLARSLGSRLTRRGVNFEGATSEIIPIILSTAGLAHDLGNPPFGHQGEAAIGSWFDNNRDVFTKIDGKDLPTNQRVAEDLWPEFLEFEGNAQTLRILTRLQVAVGGFGLDMTPATLAALMKYTVPCDKRDSANAASKKFGFFESEVTAVAWVREHTGVAERERHPLAWLMEAADDIAYSVLDIEDAMKKGIISPDDVCAIIHDQLTDAYDHLKNLIQDRFKNAHGSGRSIHEIREIKISYLRTVFIDSLMEYVSAEYYRDLAGIFNKSRHDPLLDKSNLCNLLKKIARTYVFSSPQVRKIEADGYNAVNHLMSFFWQAISDRKEFDDLLSRRRNAISSYGFSLISDNYLQCAARGGWLDRKGNELPMRYRELRLLTDMISGMTDGFAQDTYAAVKEMGYIK